MTVLLVDVLFLVLEEMFEDYCFCFYFLRVRALYAWRFLLSRWEILLLPHSLVRMRLNACGTCAVFTMILTLSKLNVTRIEACFEIRDGVRATGGSGYRCFH